MKMSLELSKIELFFKKNKHKIIKKLENPIKNKNKKTLYKRKKMKRKEIQAYRPA